MLRARVEKKDPEAIHSLGKDYHYGSKGLQKDMRKAVELYNEAAELGSIDALYSLVRLYHSGEGVQQDKNKAIQLWTKAAMKGHAESRYILGCWEVEREYPDRALRHFLISAKMGLKESLESIKEQYMSMFGNVTKEQYAEALKGYQDAVEEMKSHDRDEDNRMGYMISVRSNKA